MSGKFESMRKVMKKDDNSNKVELSFDLLRDYRLSLPA